MLITIVISTTNRPEVVFRHKNRPTLVTPLTPFGQAALSLVLAPRRMRSPWAGFRYSKRHSIRNLIASKSGVCQGCVRRETPDGNFERGEKIRECGGVVPAARCEFGRHNEPLRIHSDVQLPPIPAFL